MTGPVIVRPVDPEDASALREILNAVIAIGSTTAIETTLDAETFALWFVDGPRLASTMVALDPADGRPCGFQALDRNPDLPPGWVDVGTFARPAPKIPGVGTALFAATARRAADLGLVAINATIRADNAGGLAFYEKMGFRTYKVTPAVPLADGTPVDRISKRWNVPL